MLALQDFFAMMNKEPDRVQYGLYYVQYACEQGAVEKLLLADTLVRVQNVAKRAEVVGLVERCREQGAAVHIFSDLHTTGEQLRGLGGVAAMLRFPLPIEQFLDSEPDDDDDDEQQPQDGQARAEGQPAEPPAPPPPPPPPPEDDDEGGERQLGRPFESNY